MKPAIAIPAIALLVYRAWSRKSLTPFGIFIAFLTAIVHAVHPWSVFFSLLSTFFLAGTTVTKVKHNIKAQLTQSADGKSGGEGPRTHVQVLANSLAASVLILVHLYQIHLGESEGKGSGGSRFGSFGFVSKTGDKAATSSAARAECWPYGGSDLVVVGIVCNYAAVAADTFSSELGILSRSQPRLITSLSLRKVPPGTNGGVTLAGLLYGFLGAFIIAVTSAALLPFCSAAGAGSSGWLSRFNTSNDDTGYWTAQRILAWVACITLWGGLGSLLDSFLGGWLQQSVVDEKTGKVVEGAGGARVAVTKGRQAAESSGVDSLRQRTTRSRAKASENSDDDQLELSSGRDVGKASSQLGSRSQPLGKNAAATVGKGNENQTGNQEGHASDGQIGAAKCEKAEKAADADSARRGITGGVGRLASVAGRDVLDNNAVNLLMAAAMSGGGMLAAAWLWDF